MVFKYGYVIGKYFKKLNKLNLLKNLFVKNDCLTKNVFLGEQVGNLAVTTGRIITPSHLPETITLSVTNSSSFLILGTKPGKFKY